MPLVDEVIPDLERDEGLRLKPYRDSVGKLTIGVGRNLDDVGISMGESRLLLANDLARTMADLDRLLPWWRDRPPFRGLDPVRQRVLLNMAFNMGVGPDCQPPGSLVSFTSTLAAIQQGRYGDAADLMLKTLWARQVGARANRLSAMMRTGSTS